MKRFIMICLALIVSQGVACADSINVPRLADCIKVAESSKEHPYGIMAHYKTTTPRQACINTINHALRDWDGKGSFIAFLGSRYCPTKGKLRPAERRLNKYWVKNVSYLYKYWKVR